MENYIVFLKNGTKHSAWVTLNSALQQINVLEDYGYKDSYFEQIDHSYENGHYFV